MRRQKNFRYHLVFSNWSLVASGSNKNNKVLDYKIGIDPRIFTRSALVRKTTFRIRPIKRLLGMISQRDLDVLEGRLKA